MTISQRIFEILKEKNITQAKFAEGTGISTSAISDWKKKNTNPSADKLNDIAEFLGVSVNCLLGKDDNIQVYDEDDNIVVIDDETRDIIDSLRTNPEMKILFSVTKKATKEDIRKAVKIIEALKDDSGL